MGAREVDIDRELDNWARWCSRGAKLNDYSDCPTNWQMIDQMEYRSCHQTMAEKVREAIEHEEPRELDAIRVERVVSVCLNHLLRIAVRTHYIYLPEWKRIEKGLTPEIWTEWQARHATRRAGWYFSPLMYREAVDRAIDEIEAAL